MGRCPSVVGVVQFASWALPQSATNQKITSSMVTPSFFVLPTSHSCTDSFGTLPNASKFDCCAQGFSSFPTISSLCFSFFLSSFLLLFSFFFFFFLFIIICMPCSVHHRCDTEHEDVPPTPTHNLSFFLFFFLSVCFSPPCSLLKRRCA